MSKPSLIESPLLACEYCGGPAHLIPIVSPLRMTFYVRSSAEVNQTIRTAVACMPHSRLVMDRLLYPEMAEADR